MICLLLLTISTKFNSKQFIIILHIGSYSYYYKSNDIQSLDMELELRLLDWIESKLNVAPMTVTQHCYIRNYYVN